MNKYPEEKKKRKWSNHPQVRQNTVPGRVAGGRSTARSARNYWLGASEAETGGRRDRRESARGHEDAEPQDAARQSSSPLGEPGKSRGLPQQQIPAALGFGALRDTTGRKMSLHHEVGKHFLDFKQFLWPKGDRDAQ